MATAQQTSPYEVGRHFASLLGDDLSVVKNLWVRDAQDHIDLWLLTEPISYQQRLRLRSLKRRLYEEFPESNLAVVIHIEHAGLYDIEPEQFIFEAPHGAQCVAVR